MSFCVLKGGVCDITWNPGKCCIWDVLDVILSTIWVRLLVMMAAVEESGVSLTYIVKDSDGSGA